MTDTKNEVLKERGRPGPAPDASKPNSRYNPNGNKTLKGVRTNQRRELGGTCRHGHPLDDDNAFRDARGYLRCRVCQSNAKRKALGLPPVDSIQRRNQPVCPKGHKYVQDEGQRRCPTCRRERDIWQKYKLTPEQFDELLERQKGGCAICDIQFDMIEPWQLHVDHDHVTGAVRGLLCHSCNTAIGLLGDDRAVLQRAIDYLLR